MEQTQTPDPPDGASIHWQTRLTDVAIHCLKYAAILALTIFVIAILLSLQKAQMVRSDGTMTIVYFGVLLAVVLSHLLYLIAGLIALVTIFGCLLSTRRKGFLTAVTTLLLAYFLFAINLAVFRPVLYRARQHWDDIRCRSHMKNIAAALAAHGQATDSWPDRAHWCDILHTRYGFKEDDLVCPWVAWHSLDGQSRRSYALNGDLPVSYKDTPPNTVVLFECSPGAAPFGGQHEVETDRHLRDGSNILFANGHVQFVDATDIPSLRWKSDQNLPPESNH